MQSDALSNNAQLDDYSTLLRRRWPSLLLGLLVGVAAAVAFLALAPREYTATTAVLVTPTPATTTSSNTTGSRATDINLDTEAQLVTATDTAVAAAHTLGQPASAVDDLIQNVSVTVPPNTAILDIAYTGGSAAEAQRGSQAFAQAYLDQRQSTAVADLQAQGKAVQQQMDAVNVALSKAVQAVAALQPNTPERTRIDAQTTALSTQLTNLTDQQNQIASTTVSPGRIVSQPGLPSSPSSPSPLVVLAAGVLLGLLLGVAGAVYRQRSDDRIRTSDDVVHRTELPVATALHDRLHDGETMLVAPLSADGRGYDRLRNLVLTTLEQTGRPRALVVAGVRRGGGPVAANLAASLARTGEDVYLICGDVFGGNTSAALLADGASGLAEVLAGEQSVATAAHNLPGSPTVRVLAAGDHLGRAHALLQTRALRQLLDRLLESDAYVVIEAPATTESPDAQTLAQATDLAVLVVEAGAGSGEVREAVAGFESVGAPVVGTVFARYRGGGRRTPQGSSDLDIAAVDDDRRSATSLRVRAGHAATDLEDDASAGSEHPQLVPPNAGGRTGR